jgi:FSR family fosmidomycin resistance protein-like MFS transporter
MDTESPSQLSTTTKQLAQQTVYPILFTISFAHLINDMLQSVIPSIYPLIKGEFHLTFAQVGLIAFTFQIIASILQPFVGFYTDRKPRPFSLPVGMGLTLTGLLIASMASSYYVVLIAVSFIGLGSSIFHPESSRVAHLASGGKKGLAQSIFQLGGNAGSAIGPLLAAIIIAPYGQFNVIWFCIAALWGYWYCCKLANGTATALLTTQKTKLRTANIITIACRASG